MLCAIKRTYRISSSIQKGKAFYSKVIIFFFVKIQCNKRYICINDKAHTDNDKTHTDNHRKTIQYDTKNVSDEVGIIN